MEETIVNRIAKSNIIQVDLGQYYPKNEEVIHLDLKDYLFKGLILKEKDFREAMKSYDWNALEDKFLYVSCSSDAIIPLWAFMLIGSHAQPYAADVFFSDPSSRNDDVVFQKFVSDNPLDKIADQRFIIKGCSQFDIGPGAYSKITSYLRPHARSIMFGEPCSTVPIFKKPITRK